MGDDLTNFLFWLREIPCDNRFTVISLALRFIKMFKPYRMYTGEGQRNIDSYGHAPPVCKLPNFSLKSSHTCNKNIWSGEKAVKTINALLEAEDQAHTKIKVNEVGNNPDLY